MPGSSTYAVHHAGKQSQIHRKHAEPSRADRTPEEMKATYSSNVNNSTNTITEEQK
jgi:hypothetical protein